MELNESLMQSLGEKLPLFNSLPSLYDARIQMKDDDDSNVIFPLGQVATEFGEMKKGNYYLKRGRSTGLTVGRCNGIEADIQSQGFRYTEDGKLYELGKHTTREFIVLSFEAIFNGDSKQTGFSQPGDSGALVVDVDGQVCGLLYGEHTGLCGNRHDIGAGLVTWFEAIQASVAAGVKDKGPKNEDVSGEFVLPKQNGHGFAGG